MSYVSASALNQLYSDMATFVAANSVDDLTAQESVVSYLRDPQPTDPAVPTVNVYYNNMVANITAWLASDPNGYTVANDSLRVQVIQPDGVTSYDSKSTSANIFTNIGKPTATVNGQWNGKYLINENQGSRSYNMGASLSQSGVFNQQKFSNSISEQLIYLAVRQGTSAADPLGNIVLSVTLD